LSASAAVDTPRLVATARDPAAPVRERQLAFTQLVERSQHRVFGLALTLLRDADDARDAVQEAYATAWLRLSQLRDPSAFCTWLNTIVATQCTRQLRRRTRRSEPVESSDSSVEVDGRRLDYQALLASAVGALPEGERHVTVLFYFLGYSQPEIARLLRLKPGTVGKRLHSARLRIRRALPPSVRGDFMRVTPSRTFAEQVRLGIYDEYVGEYRFPQRPGAVVIVREGDSLVSISGQQRHVLASLGEASFVTRHYDGEGRFGRNRLGEVTHFVYYEFGRRMGVAWKTDRATR
jgi:RNA polymerase sigma factor (sigma-70 family)